MTQIPPKTALRLLDSVAFMNSEFGVAFNGMITLNFDQLGVSTAAGKATAHTALNEAISRKLSRFAKAWNLGAAGAHRFLYVHEHVETFGHHVHELVAIPDALRLEFAGWLKEWRQRSYPSADPRALHFRTPARAGMIEQQTEAQTRLVRYVLKTAAPAVVRGRDGSPVALHDMLGLSEVRRSTHIAVKRIAGTSQNISRLSQYDVGFEVFPFEDVLNGDCLRHHWRRKTNEELTAQLRAIEL